MKIALYISVMCGVLVSSAVVLAQTTPTGSISAPSPVSAVQKPQAHYQVELLYSTYTQNENVLKAAGNLAGFSLGGVYDFKNSDQMILWGIEYYTGTPTNEATSTSGTFSSKTADTDFYTFGVSWGVHQKLGASSFTAQESLGAAYRYFESRVRGGHSAQQEQIFAYLPIGLGLNWQATDKWQLRAAAEEDVLLSGSSRQHLENISPTMPTLAMSENTGSGTKLSIGARKIGQDLDLTGEVYYRNWQIAKSSTQDYIDAKGHAQVGQTPANSTEMVGLGFGVTY